ncbi:MAG: glycosyltransferase family 2 protein [Wenzhouxiangella sp.]
MLNVLKNSVSDKDILNSIETVKKSRSNSNVVVFSIMKDERFFVGAFLDYYRRLGVGSFLILDDGSTDGTLEFLLNQSDVTVLKSSFKYGQVINRRGRLPWRSAQMRAGIRLKALIPNNHLKNRWCIYADADEFLVLPSQFDGIDRFTQVLDGYGLSVVLSVVVEMYPDTISDLLDGPAKLNSFEELLELSRNFDAIRLLSLTDNGEVNRLNVSASGRLFRAHDILFGNSNEVGTLEEARQSRGTKQLAIGTAINKISLLKPGSGTRMVCGHWANVPPASEVALAILHFKFTPDVIRRAQAALESRAWAQGSAKYSNYELLFQRMKEAGSSFLGPDSLAYRDPSQLEASGNLWCKLPAEVSSEP